MNTGKEFSYLGIIFSDRTRILYKDNLDIRDAFEIKKDYVNGVQKTFISFSIPIPGITYDVVHKLGICNLTVVNFADGTQDSVLFNVSKFYTKYPDKIDSIIGESSITCYFYQHITKIFVSIGNIHKFISIYDDSEYEWNVTFVNLNAGTHVMNLYHPETDFIRQFSYNITFEIKGFNHDKNTINSIQNNTFFNRFPNMSLIGENDFSGYGIFNVKDIRMEYKFKL